MVEHVNESVPPPRIRVTLPGGGPDLPAYLLGWDQGPDGSWRARVAVDVPAGAVHQVEGEDYAGVPRAHAGPRYVLAVDTRLRPPEAELHLATCWILDTPAAWRRVTPIPDADQARDQARIPGTLICRECAPIP